MANIAIFRINYKSDFILTLNSDAGWMTPFCIKFWTGAPSQAYFVGFDGTTYTNCAPVAGEPTKLLVQFDDHHLPIGDLKFQIGYHFTVADFPNDTEDEVLNQANITTEIDGETYQVMLDFNGETAPEIEFSLPAYANEAQRIANEEQRIAAEQQRIANEDARIQAEETRQQNEQQRIQHEEYRVSEFARLKSESEAATTAANAAATLANEKAQLAADKAALAQAAATLANEKAQLAADKAALAAAAATLANDKATLAQQKAAYAQEQGDYAKAQGDYAKAQGDTAQADHERAEADHTTAAADHTTAAADHTTATSDHSRAESDHTTASSDHTRAESDHTTASSDHTRAESDHTTAASDHTRAESDHTIAAADHTTAQADHTRAESDHAAVEVYVDSLGVFDLSKHNAVGGVLATYANLDAAINALNALDSQYKYGGMSFKFVQSSDNKYVQYRLMADEFTTDTTQWQGVDDEPTSGSENLVKSGGVSYHTRLLNPLNKTSVLNITGFGTTGSSGNVLGIGDIYYNTTTKKLRRLIEKTPDQIYEDVGFDYAFYYDISTGDFYHYDNVNKELVLHNINGNEYDDVSEVGVQLHELYNGIVPYSNYTNNFLILEFGIINEQGKTYSRNDRVRFSKPLYAPFIIEVNDGYTITTVNEYNVKEDGTLAFKTDKALSSKVFCATQNAYRPLIKKDNLEDFQLSELPNVIKSIVFLPTNCIRLTGIGTSGQEAGISKIGDIYYNTTLKKLRCAVKTNLTSFEDYPVSDNTVCLYNGEEYRYFENYGLVSSTKDAIITSAVNLNTFSEIQLEQGGLNVSGWTDSSNNSKSVRSPYYLFSRGVSIKLLNDILVKPFYYDNTGTLVKTGDFTGVLQELTDSNVTFVRFLFQKSDLSDLTPNDVINAMTFNGSYVPYIKRDNSIYEEVESNKIVFDQGAIDFNNGEDTDNSYDYRIRTSYLKFSDNASKIEIQSASTNFFIIFFYDENKKFISRTNWTQAASVELKGYIRVVVKKDINDSETFSPSDENLLYKIILPADRVSNSSSIPELEQGGLTSFGLIDDTPGYAEKRVRTVDFIKCINLNLTLNDGYLVKVYVYGIDGKLYSTDYLSNISFTFNYNERIKLLFKKSDSSDVSVTDIEQNITECSIVYSKGTGEIIDHRIDKCVLLTEPMIGIPSVYVSDTYQKVDIESKTSTELYAEYDNLASSYPTVFKRLDDIGYDSDNNPIRAYELGFNQRLATSGEGFNPNNNNIWSEIYNPKKIIITSGVHGDEKTASWGLMLAIKEIVESAESWATYIKANFVIRIVPCVNVWGFNNMSRLDKDGHDINRDYGKWITPSGQSLKNFYNNNNDAVYYLDVHGTQGTICYYEVSRYSDWYYLHARTISKIRAALYSNWLQLYNTSSIISGFLSSSQNYGMLIQYCETELGIPSGITETPRCYDGNDNVNYLSSCKLTKDMVINMIQMYGSSVVKYDKNKQ